MVRVVEAVVGPEGWTTWDRLVAQLSPATVRAWVAAGRLVHLDAGVYAVPHADWRIRVAAIARQRHGVVSHGTALALWGLVPPPTGPLHLSVAPGRSGRGSLRVVLHRGRDLDWHVRRVAGMPVTSVERSLVDAWGSPGGLDRAALRAAAITAVRERRCSAGDLATELARRPRLPGRAELAELVRLLAEGCRSELEIWGCLHVLRGPGMPTFVQQRPVVVGSERFLLDAACEEVLLAVELDGAAWHGSRAQRERDIRRDALVATIGWQTLRFGYTRLTTSPEPCRSDVRTAYEVRRRLFRRDGVR
jgi:very-short-patch-repair endonuclease